MFSFLFFCSGSDICLVYLFSLIFLFWSDVVSLDLTRAKTTDGAGFSFCLVADDVEPAVAKAVKAGASVVEPVSDSEAVCCGARSVTVKDPFGYVWSICAAEKSCADVEA